MCVYVCTQVCDVFPFDMCAGPALSKEEAWCRPVRSTGDVVGSRQACQLAGRGKETCELMAESLTVGSRRNSRAFFVCCYLR